MPTKNIIVAGKLTRSDSKLSKGSKASATKLKTSTSGVKKVDLPSIKKQMTSLKKIPPSLEKSNLSKSPKTKKLTALKT